MLVKGGPGELEACFFIRGLFDSSYGLSSWVPLLALAAMNAMSFASDEAADVLRGIIDGVTDAEFNFVLSFLCSVTGIGKVISFSSAIELVGVLFWLLFSQLAHLISFSHSRSSCPAWLHFAHLWELLQNLLPCPYFWQLKQRWWFGRYDFVSRWWKPTLILWGIVWLLMVSMYGSSAIKLPSSPLLLLSILVIPCGFNSSCIYVHVCQTWSHLITHLE